jgi:hypothetical protein
MLPCCAPNILEFPTLETCPSLVILDYKTEIEMLQSPSSQFLFCGKILLVNYLQILLIQTHADVDFSQQNRDSFVR